MLFLAGAQWVPVSGAALKRSIRLARLTRAQRARRLYLRAYCAERYHRRRRVALLFLFQRQGHAGCAACRASGVPFVIDHIDPATKTREPCRLLTCALPVLWRELRLCQPLCEECNRAKSAIDSQWRGERPGGAVLRDYWRRRRAREREPARELEEAPF